jgi:hypothetical protein
MISFLPVKKIVIIVFFFPVACSVLEMTSVGDHADISEDPRSRKIGTRTHHLLRFLEDGSLPTRENS